jgi:hypothetical protein
MVGVGDEVSGLFARALVWGDVDPHGVAWAHAMPVDGGAVVVEVRASTLFVCLGGWVKDANACELHTEGERVVE